jgi:hypothetical protein
MELARRAPAGRQKREVYMAEEAKTIDSVEALQQALADMRVSQREYATFDQAAGQEGG